MPVERDEGDEMGEAGTWSRPTVIPAPLPSVDEADAAVQAHIERVIGALRELSEAISTRRRAATLDRLVAGLDVASRGTVSALDGCVDAGILLGDPEGTLDPADPPHPPPHDPLEYGA